MERQELESLQAHLRKVERWLRGVVVGWLFSMVTVALVLVVVAEQAKSGDTALRTLISQSAEANRTATIQALLEHFASGKSVLRARAIEIVDSAGRKNIEMGVFPDGTAGLLLYGAVGKARIELGVRPDGFSGLRLFDSAEKARIVLAVDTDPRLGFHDATRRPRIVLALLPGGMPGVVLFDGAGRTLFSAP